MADLPEYLTDQTEEAIRDRMLSNIPDDIDKSEGSFIWDAIEPAAIELALAATWAQEVLNRGFAQTTFGAYLDNRADEHGLTRRAAVQATGTVTFTGTPGTLIPSGTQVSTASTDTSPAIVFSTTVDATITASGTVDVPVQAVEGGSSGNVSAGSIVFMAQPLAGVSSVTNAAATSGGLDQESDAELLARYLTKVRNPSAGGNKADYINWALEVSGVGGVSVVPVRDGPGTVSIAIIDTNKAPASQDLVDAVQDYIAPPWVNILEADTMTIGGYGVSVDTTQSDASGGKCVKMVYDSQGNGTLTQDIKATLQQPGIWQARVLVKVDSTADTTDDLLQIGIWDVSANGWANTSPSSSSPAMVTLKAGDLSTSFVTKIVEFYWNSEDDLQIQVNRLTSNTTTTVWVDQVILRSTFSQDTGEGKAPIGARVTVEPAGVVTINVSATLTLLPGYDRSSVQAAATQAVEAYLKSVAFADVNDVQYTRIGDAILNTLGVQDYQNLLVNGGTANVAVDVQQVAVLGSVTWS
ncbi:MAG: baseplate J/gp47 family protein [Alicyclobacillus macrosporangiidus]|uniref:baseplate J/gp47 family protein n=1 Tax=Alicyclobacillus macrosporangiidus TaxID=392015 RepID=UPI0026EA9FBC|nr:baseplate J/gp47 family protein [Alicyclobacillus macrosporangiidus]MCL6597931.1 baseplate J/gp47 family protein [Alicyclobacillus macrosporangiidus]